MSGYGEEQIGRVLGGRYRLVAAVGTGASATVYQADDVQLRRRVAVKVLHPSLAEDAAFLRRFQAEAQAAAALSHPNIMAIFDWGSRPDRCPTWCSSTWAGAACGPCSTAAGCSQPVAGAARRPRGQPGPRLRPPPGLRPPGHQARQPPLRRGPPPAHRRLRAGPGHRRRGVDRAVRRAPRAPPATRRQSRPRASPSTARATCTPSPSRWSSRSPGRCPSPARRRWRRS